MLRAALLLYLAACNQIYGLDETKVRPMDAREPCIAGTPFGAGVEVPVAGNNSIESARFTPNRSAAFLSLCTPGTGIGTCELYTSLYSTETETFGGFSKLTGISVPDVYDSYPSVTADNNFLVFASSRNSAAQTDPRIFVAEAVGGSFDAPNITALPTANVGANEPYLVTSNILYFSLASSGGSNLYRMEGTPPAFGNASNAVSGILAFQPETHAPVVRADELEIFFSAGPSIPGLDIYTATRPSRTDDFVPMKIDSVSTAGIDYPVWIAPDGCELYYINKQNNVAKLFVAKR